MQDEDKRLLEMAAKAMGWTQAEFQDMRGWGEVRYGFSEAMWVPEIGGYWNPLANNDQALRLAVKLRISVMLAETDPCTPDCAYAETLPGGPVWRYIYTKDGDPLAATRRAIVRAAAALTRIGSKG